MSSVFLTFSGKNAKLISALVTNHAGLWTMGNLLVLDHHRPGVSLIYRCQGDYKGKDAALFLVLETGISNIV